VASQESTPKRRLAVWAWVASALVVIAGIIVIIIGLHGPRVGPSLPAPVGNTSVGTSSFSAPTRSELLPFLHSSAFSATSASETFRVEPALAQSLGRTTTSELVAHSLQAPYVQARRTRSVRVDHATTAFVRSAPVHLSIPSLKISVSVTQLGLNSDGTVQVPGQMGSAAILGHVDSTSGPGVFYKIVDMKVGQLVQVTLADHVSLKFKVIGLRQYSKGNFPDKLIYGPSTFSALDLVTCGGVFDPTTHHYLSNIVVFTALVTK
jgi:hypothetical protein